MRIYSLHDWCVSVPEARRIQERLCGRVVRRGPRGPVRTVAGCDVSYDRGSNRFFAGVVLLGYPGLEILERRGAEGTAPFPYVPGYLSFREAPVLLEALGKLGRRPGAVILDGHGLAHPRGLGLASHVGLFLRTPTVGCAKKRLVGTHEEPARERGAAAPLVRDGAEIGRVLRTRAGVKPVYVSVGHLVGLDEATELVLSASTRYRLPEPTRLAHNYVNELRRAAKNRGKGNDL